MLPINLVSISSNYSIFKSVQPRIQAAQIYYLISLGCHNNKKPKETDIHQRYYVPFDFVNVATTLLPFLTIPS